MCDAYHRGKSGSQLGTFTRFLHIPPRSIRRQAERNVANPQVLDRYVGKYEAPQAGTMQVTRDQNTLSLTIGDKKYVLCPESEAVFFTRDRDLTFEFVKSDNKQISRLAVREHGAVVEKATIVK